MASNWALVIGINQYDVLQPLSYAKRDAQLMQEFLSNEVGCERIFFFSDDSPPMNGKSTRPNRSNLLRVLRQLFEQSFMQAEDNFWFFFSGHGMRHNDRDYLMPSDGDPYDIENTAISINFVSERLRRCGADNVVLILDACRNTGTRGEGIGRQTEDMARTTGIISIFSCSPNEYSYEIDALQQGAFTHALLEGLGIRGRCATVERLNQYLSFQVPELVNRYKKARQTPYMIVEPVNKSHLILVPRNATLADIATLKNDALMAEVNKQHELAEQLWIRVLAAASGQDTDAIRALKRIALIRHQEPPLDTNPPPRVNSATKSPTTTTNFLKRIFQQARRSIQQRKILVVSVAVVAVFVLIVYGTKLSHFNPVPDTQPIASASPTNSTNPSKPTSVPSADNLSSEKGVDYTQLRNFLKAGQWKEADYETYKVMLKVVGREDGDWIRDSELLNFPCTDLRTIDSLWVQYSNGRFGFSVQKKIYLEVGGKLDGKYYEEAWNKFGDRVGWRVNQNWIIDLKVTYDTTSPVGHLPAKLTLYRPLNQLTYLIFSRIHACKM